MSILMDVVVGIAVLGVLAALIASAYRVTGILPRRFAESARAWVFLGPAAVALLVGLVIPAIRTIYLSFFDNTGDVFVGLDNYTEIFSTAGTRLTFFNSLTWILVGTTSTVLVGLVVARFAEGLKRQAAVKAAIFLPGAVSLVGVGLIWGFVYAGPPFDVGLLNQITGAIPGLAADMGGEGNRLWLLERGLGGLEPPQTAPGFNTILLIIVFVWSQAGLATVVFSAAIKGVPIQLVQAARVDGATERQIFYRVVLPFIRSTVVMVATIVTVSGLKAFDIVAVATGGNFGTSTIANEFYVKRFVQGRAGIGAALAVLIFVLVIPVIALNREARTRAEKAGL